MAKTVERISQVTIRFAGDSGDGMQLTGARFTSETAVLGNDLSTLPDFPAEIRAPAGSLPGVSGFQIHFADHDILTPGDRPNVLVAMNPAALKTNIKDLPKGGTLIVNSDAFSEKNLDKAGYASNPLDDGTLADYALHAIPLTSMTLEAVKDAGVTSREAERAKNMFALGLMSWLYTRPTDATIGEIETKFAKRPEIAEANIRAFQAGYAFGETTEAFAVQYEVAPAKMAPGVYRNVTGNQALALGLVAAGVKSGLPLFLGAYPITPASGILEELAGLQALRQSAHSRPRTRSPRSVRRSARPSAARWASPRRAAPGSCSSRRRSAWRSRSSCRWYPRHPARRARRPGMPTKPEQGDLLNVMFGRNSESPVPVIAAATPGDCFDATLEACRMR
jgi:2-oxoglutarate ferredoxin oxidoreductase subunit alpha